jgi:hypothetical protein
MLAVLVHMTLVGMVQSGQRCLGRQRTVGRGSFLADLRILADWIISPKALFPRLFEILSFEHFHLAERLESMKD